MTSTTGEKTMTASDASTNPGTLSVNVSRFIRAPRQRVFDAWVKPELRRRWWRTHRGEGLSACEVDARVGGRYRMKQLGGGCESADDNPKYEWIMDGQFLEVDPPRKLVFTWNVNHDPPTVDERVTIEFHDVEGGTDVTLKHEGILSPVMRDGTEGGWTTHLKAIAELLEQENPSKNQTSREL